jgi:nucleotidyltransferase substrate binding protein (TIGR01987 family)
MSNEKDIRWQQRFSNYIKAFEKLEEGVHYITQNSENIKSKLSEIIEEGLVQRFEYTHELAWKVMKDYAEYQGNNSIGGSRDATREALGLKLISTGDVWMDMIQSRNETSHTYNNVIAQMVVKKIITDYFPAFRSFKKTMEAKLPDIRSLQYGLHAAELQKIVTVFTRYSEIEQAVLFGSRAKGNNKPYSDIDIALKGEKLDLSIKGKIENELDDLLLPYKIDMLLFQHIRNDDLLEHIQRAGKVLYSGNKDTGQDI